MASYIVHIIRDKNNHTIIFDADNIEVKAKLVDYLAYYTNTISLTSISQAYDLLVDNTTVVQFKVNIKADLKEVKNILNYLQE
jgi:hypothetical protein